MPYDKFCIILIIKKISIHKKMDILGDIPLTPSALPLKIFIGSNEFSLSGK